MLISLLFSILAGPSSFAATPLVTCELQNFKICKNCNTRIPASCEDHTYNGSVALTTRPLKLIWLISNNQTGIDKRVTTDAGNLTIQSLTTSAGITAALAAQKVALTTHEKAALTAIQIPASTALYQAQTGLKIAAQMTAKSPSRMVASEQILAGGVRRAQKFSTATPAKKKVSK